MKYPYFRGLEADRYSFYRVPKALIKVDLFEKMSGDAKLLYAVLLDRMNLSLKNGWQDENGNAYIICTIDEIMDSIRCARQKAVKLLDELEHEYQLIERRRQGLGKPNLLYVKDLYPSKDADMKGAEEDYNLYQNLCLKNDQKCTSLALDADSYIFPDFLSHESYTFQITGFENLQTKLRRKKSLKRHSEQTAYESEM